MTVGQAYKFLCESLLPIYERREASSVAYRLLEDAFGFSRIDVVVRESQQITDLERFMLCAARLKQGEPVQYVVGFETFMGRRFAVAPGVLIPRPETEEIVVNLLAILDKNESYTILDVGTGSGAIAISLAAELPNASISACDISPEVLEIARSNARALGVNVEFYQDDIFLPGNISNKYDIIISNPPYVTELERLQIHLNVNNYEPSTALYVPDDNPIKYYIAITDYAIKTLNNSGRLVFEINERYSSQIVDYMNTKKFKNIEVHKDFNEKDRMVWATK